MRDRSAGRDVLAALRETLRDDSCKRRAQFGLVEIVLGDALTNLRLLQLSSEHCQLRPDFVELRLRDRAADLFEALQLALRHRALRVDARDFGLRVLDAQPHGLVLQLRDALAGAHTRSDFGDVLQPSRGAGREPRIVAADDATRHPASRRDARDRSLRDFHHDARLLRRRSFCVGTRCEKSNRGRSASADNRDLIILIPYRAVRLKPDPHARVRALARHWRSAGTLRSYTSRSRLGSSTIENTMLTITPATFTAARPR